MNKFTVVILAASAVLIAAPAMAQEEGSAWGVACSTEGEARLCSVRQELFVTESDAADAPLQRLLTVAIQPDRSGADSLLLILPHGVLFPAGVFAGVDQATPGALQMLTSEPTGALASAPLTMEMLAAMRSGNDLQVTFSTVDGQTLTVPVTLEDFGPAFDRMKQGVADE